ncbi:MAG: hypothetical protein ACLR01_10845 [Vescimonas sp.]
MDSEKQKAEGTLLGPPSAFTEREMRYFKGPCRRRGYATKGLRRQGLRRQGLRRQGLRRRRALLPRGFAAKGLCRQGAVPPRAFIA